jgi:hypothetical protein
MCLPAHLHFPLSILLFLRLSLPSTRFNALVKSLFYYISTPKEYPELIIHPSASSMDIDSAACCINHGRTCGFMASASCLRNQALTE